MFASNTFLQHGSNWQLLYVSFGFVWASHSFELTTWLFCTQIAVRILSPEPQVTEHCCVLSIFVYFVLYIYIKHIVTHHYYPSLITQMIDTFKFHTAIIRFDVNLVHLYRENFKNNNNIKKQKYKISLVNRCSQHSFQRGKQENLCVVCAFTRDWKWKPTGDSSPSCHFGHSWVLQGRSKLSFAKCSQYLSSIIWPRWCDVQYIVRRCIPLLHGFEHYKKRQGLYFLLFSAETFFFFGFYRAIIFIRPHGRCTWAHAFFIEFIPLTSWTMWVIDHFAMVWLRECLYARVWQLLNTFSAFHWTWWPLNFPSEKKWQFSSWKGRNSIEKFQFKKDWHWLNDTSGIAHLILIVWFLFTAHCRRNNSPRIDLFASRCAELFAVA